MSIEQIDLSMDGPNGPAIRITAQEAGLPVSTWLAQATPAQLRNVALRAVLDDWQAENGYFTDAEMDEASRELQLGKWQNGRF